MYQQDESAGGAPVQDNGMGGGPGGAIGGAGVGFLKYLEDLHKERRERKMQAQMAQYSPWTRLDADPTQIKKANFTKDVYQGAVSGSAFGQGLEKGDTAGAMGMGGGGGGGGAGGGGQQMADAGTWAKLAMLFAA
jgi:hypothetical protein